MHSLQSILNPVKTVPDTVDMNIIYVKEEHPPKGNKPGGFFSAIYEWNRKCRRGFHRDGQGRAMGAGFIGAYFLIENFIVNAALKAYRNNCSLIFRTL
ncbi:hypothetical protein FACS1894110_12090 [Spirochaetia bacterium]|nr:hypothetical protein FACS1894110_12090 [Spirochaetia bacterium]